MMRRSSLSAAVALRQLAQRSQTTAPAAAATSNAAAAHLSSVDLSMEPTQRFRHIAAASPLLSKETKVSAEQLIGVDLAHPALLAAQVKDAALLSKVADDFLSLAGANWQLEITSFKYEQSLPVGKPFDLDLDYLSALALSRGSSFSN
jgi:hypothetical protein